MPATCDRYWLLTNTTYGTWLPDDVRGFVSRVTDIRFDDPITDHRIEHNIPGTPYDEDIPGLVESSSQLMRGPPVRLTKDHALILIKQFQETAGYPSWTILAASVMWNHFHLVVGVPDDPKPGKILGDFKSWGTRMLYRRFGQPASLTWWTERGSKRKLKDQAAVQAAAQYVLYKQPNPLLIWRPGMEITPVSVEA